jgi:NitT/TauT family transport system permease protein
MEKIRYFFLSVFIIVLFFVLWETASRLYIVNPAFVPPFTKVMFNAVRMLVSGGLAFHIRMSLFRAFLGTLIAVILGIPLGFFLSPVFTKIRLALGTLAELLSFLSPFLLFHILILFMGIGESVKVTIIVWACIWPVAFNTAAGVENIDALLLKAGRAFGGGRIKLFFKVMLPAAAPRIFTGIRLGAGYSLFMLVAAEMMGGHSGLGWLIINDQVNFQLENIFSTALIIALIGIMTDGFMAFIQKRLIPYELEEYVNSSGA